MAFENYIAHKSAFVFGFDNVLYPEKDYLLQVYYLFAEFIEYSEQLNAKSIIAFMQSAYADEGSVDIFDKTALKFNIPSKYKANFELLHENARLPLKLLLFKNILTFLQEIVIERKEIFLLVSGSPLMQLNKIRQIEWHGLEKYLKVYFSEEIEALPTTKSLAFIVDQHQLNKENVLSVGNERHELEVAKEFGVSFLPVSKLL